MRTAKNGKILMFFPEQYKLFFRSAWKSAPAEEQTLNELTLRLILKGERSNSVKVAKATAKSRIVTVSVHNMWTQLGHESKDCYKNKQCKIC